MKWLWLLFVLTCFALVSFSSNEMNEEITTWQTPDPKLKSKALIVLQNKCNDCHRKKNKSVIFTKDNMNSKSRKIYKQVFVKKKMPKEDVTLTTSERKDLQLWLDSLNP